MNGLSRSICDDVWMDMFPLFDRVQLGLKLALLSPRFDALVDAHFNGKKELPIWRRITIDKDNAEKKAQLYVDFGPKNFKPFPLPKHKLPANIRLKEFGLKLEHVDNDQSVTEFLLSNQHIFDENTTYPLLVMPYSGDVLKRVAASKVWSILAEKLHHLTIDIPGKLRMLRQHVSPTILTDFKRLNSIEALSLFPQVVADHKWDTIVTNNTEATDEQALFVWLHTPTADGKTKTIQFGDHTNLPQCYGWIENFVDAFLSAKTPTNYCLEFTTPVYEHIEPFKEVNKKTKEMLTMEELGRDVDRLKWLLKRCPAGATEFRFCRFADTRWAFYQQ